MEKNLVGQCFQLGGQSCGCCVGQRRLLGELRSGHHGRATRVSSRREREDGYTDVLIDGNAGGLWMIAKVAAQESRAGSRSMGIGGSSCDAGPEPRR